MFRNKGPSHRGTISEMSTTNKAFASTTQRQAGSGIQIGLNKKVKLKKSTKCCTVLLLYAYVQRKSAVIVIIN